MLFNFGGVSSAGIFDRIAKIVLWIAIEVSSIRHDNVIQHLDDVVACTANSNMAAKFDKAYQEVCNELGVELAPRDDVEKSFAPSTKGVVLGIYYDSVNWVW